MDPRPLLRSVVQLCSIVALILVAGCGSGYNKVSGTASYKGKNLTMGTITFYSGDGKSKVFTTIGPNGYYEAIDPPLGKVRVGIAVKPPAPVNLVPGGKDKEKDKGTAKPKSVIGDTPSTNVEPVIIPPHYADPGKSGLATELRSGSNTFDITMEDAGVPEKKAPEKKQPR